MSDAISEQKKEEESIRLKKIIPSEHANRLRALFPKYNEFLCLVNDLNKLGYKVDIKPDKVEIWKSI